MLCSLLVLLCSLRLASLYTLSFFKTIARMLLLLCSYIAIAIAVIVICSSAILFTEHIVLTLVSLLLYTLHVCSVPVGSDLLVVSFGSGILFRWRISRDSTDCKI